MKLIRVLMTVGILMIPALQTFAQEEESRAVEEWKRQKALEEAHRKEMREMELRQMHLQKEIMEARSAELMAKFDEESEKEGLAFLKEYAPSHYYDRLVELKSSNPLAYKESVVEALQRKWNIHSRAGENEDYLNELTEIFALDMETRQLVRDYKSAGAGERQAIRSRLHETLGQLFDLREREREREMTKLKERLAALQDNLSLRKQNKSLIVDNRLKQLLGEASNLEW